MSFKTICISILLLIVVTSATADPNELKAVHDKTMLANGEIRFSTDAVHYLAYFDNIATSVYTKDNQKCLYTKHNDRQYYRTVTANTSKESSFLQFQDKITQYGETHTLTYRIVFHHSTTTQGYQVVTDRQKSSLIASDADWQKIVACILKYAPKLYKSIKDCLGTKELSECLKIIGPGLELYKCIFGEGNSVAAQGISYRTISFFWSWGYSRAFPTNAIYKEMPYPIVAFDSVKTTGKNAWNIQISAVPTGNKIAKVSLARASYMAYPKFWSSSVSGSVRCVMQKP